MDPNQQPQNQTPQQPMPAAPQQPYAAPQENPGQLFGILSIVFFFVFPIVGIVLGVMSRNKSKEANMPTTLGSIGMWMNIVAIVLGVLWFILLIIIGVASSTSGA